MKNKYDIVIIGGLGHVGLPLGIVFADKGLRVCLNDINKETAELIKKGKMPFVEYGAEEKLKKVLKNGNLVISLEKDCIQEARNVIISVGTPIDEYLNPKTRQFLEFFNDILKYIIKDQLVIIRSSIFPNTASNMYRMMGEDSKLAYCPERIVQGYAVKELAELPQIVAGMNEKSVCEASDLFNIVSPKIIKTSMKEAELIKLFSNAWRYIQFATANQFYMISKSYGVDYDMIRFAMVDEYRRNISLPSAGFAAGPCLLKDTMQLASLPGAANFMLGHSAMLVNEGLPNFIVENLKKDYDLTKTKVGILGMAFKAEVDDIRDSLSFKLGKILRFYGAEVYYSDEFAKNVDFVTKEELIERSEVIIIGVPHSAYWKLKFPEGKYIVNIWGTKK